MSGHREESIANKVKICKFMLGWLRCVWFVDKLVSNTVRQELRNKVETGGSLILGWVNWIRSC